MLEHVELEDELCRKIRSLARFKRALWPRSRASGSDPASCGVLHKGSSQPVSTRPYVRKLIKITINKSVNRPASRGQVLTNNNAPSNKVPAREAIKKMISAQLMRSQVIAVKSDSAASSGPPRRESDNSNT